MTTNQKQEFTYRITNANSTEMIVILYDMLLCYTKEGREAKERQDEDGIREAFRKIRGCLNELIQSLDFRYAPASQLNKLYLFCIRRLTQGEMQNDDVCLGEIERVITPLRDAYSQIAGQNPQGPVMGNSQKVYAGLTYGKNQLSEDMTDQGANRGMFA